MGFGSSSLRWFRQLPGLSREYHAVTFDNRGTGQSDKPDIPYTMEMLAGDTAGLLDAIGIDVAHIYGISMGGMVAQEFGLRYPERVISLVLGCTTCGGPNSIRPDAQVMTSLFDMDRLQQRTPEEVAKETLPLICSQKFIDGNPDIVEQFIANTVAYATPPHGYMRQAEAIMGHDTFERLPDIKAPTLVIGGDSDRIVPAENLRILASRIPDAELVVLENIGHGFYIEATDEANEIMLDFLKRHRCSG